MIWTIVRQGSGEKKMIGSTHDLLTARELVLSTAESLDGGGTLC
jgi:nicotinamide mononucleotide (NMN) deamidase PncC